MPCFNRTVFNSLLERSFACATSTNTHTQTHTRGALASHRIPAIFNTFIKKTYFKTNFSWIYSIKNVFQAKRDIFFFFFHFPHTSANVKEFSERTMPPLNMHAYESPTYHHLLLFMNTPAYIELFSTLPTMWKKNNELNIYNDSLVSFKPPLFNTLT